MSIYSVIVFVWNNMNSKFVYVKMLSDFLKLHGEKEGKQTKTIYK